MPVRIVVGAQYGDEGKGKMVDYLSQYADLIVRFQGGDNAGHTVVNAQGAFKLHLIPCGIFEPQCSVLIGTGTVVNPNELLKEMSQLADAGVDLSRLYVSEKAVILMPYHVEKDQLSEAGKSSIGTTKRGIGPAYADKALRLAFRFEDLLDEGSWAERIDRVLPLINAPLVAMGGTPVEASEIMAWFREWQKHLAPRIVHPLALVHRALEAQKSLVFEGQLGAMKDLDWGIYPYVTSSHPVAAYACVSSGIPIRAVTDILGVAKAFSSAVGAGPFPTEMDEEFASQFRGTGREVDDEFGARTGRARRLGWLDLPVLRHAALVNGFTELAVLKMDKLDDFECIQICEGYELDGVRLQWLPKTNDLWRVKPIYRSMPGWKTSTRNIRKIADLPAEARAYLRVIEQAVGVPVRYVGVGPEREQLAV